MRKIRLLILFVFALLACPAFTLYAQSQSSSEQSPPSQQPQSQPQPQDQPKASPDDKADSVAEAARKAKEKRAAAAKGKVFTEDDLSGKKGGVSVVGNEGKKSRRAPTGSPNGDYEPNGEEYWRSRSQPILDEIAATDQQIAQLREDIKKYGNGGFDVQTARQQNIAYIHDRNAQIDELQKRKASLQKQLEDLEEEGRKAGAPPAWFR